MHRKKKIKRNKASQMGIVIALDFGGYGCLLFPLNFSALSKLSKMISSTYIHPQKKFIEISKVIIHT